MHYTTLKVANLAETLTARHTLAFRLPLHISPNTRYKHPINNLSRLLIEFDHTMHVDLYSDIGATPQGTPRLLVVA